MSHEHYTVQIEGDISHSEPTIDRICGIVFGKRMAKQHPGRQVILWRHIAIDFFMDETVNNRDVEIYCEACGFKAKVIQQGTAQERIKCPACWREI